MSVGMGGTGGGAYSQIGGSESEFPESEAHMMRQQTPSDLVHGSTTPKSTSTGVVSSQNVAKSVRASLISQSGAT